MSSDLRSRLAPRPGERVDAAFATVLAVLGVVGFRTVFAGGEELLVGVPAVLAGAATGYVLGRRRVPLVPAVAVATAVLLVLGGPLALRHRALFGILPTPGAVVGLADGIVNGWVQLLTTLPPAGEAGDLLAIPYLCGFAGGALAVALAVRFPRHVWCVLPPVAVLAASVLMGTRRPASLLLQGVAFAAITLAWVSVRHHRNRTIDPHRRALSRSRLTSAAALLLVSAVIGVVVGRHLPGADASERFVLRDRVEPPFDPLTEPSPLGSYRNYTDQDVREDEVLTVTGLPEGARLRIAALDAYSGTVWNATGDGSVVAGEYLRVGAEIPSEGRGEEAEVQVEVHRPEGVWVPLAGDVTGVDFAGERGDALDDDVRVSIETDTAAVPGELRAGDRYSFRARFVDLPSEGELADLPLDGRFERRDVEVPPEFVSRGAEWARDQPTPFAEVLAIAEGLRTEGAFTDGGEDANPVSPPGHGLRRLLDFIGLEQPFGNGEQFAAAQGLLAQSRGIPVRVVMGFVNEGGGDEVTFRGEDLDAWIEVPVEGYGWVAVDGTPPEDQLPDPLKQPRSKTENPEPQPPPPTTIPPPTSIPDELEPEDPEDDRDEDDASGLPAWIVALGAAAVLPVLGLGVPCLIIVGLKRRRRSLRRTAGTPGARVAGSFDELVDGARDLRRPVPPAATRHEVAAVLAVPGAAELAARADTARFGATGTSEEEAAAAWDLFAESHGELHADLARRERLLAAVNPASLRPPR